MAYYRVNFAFSFTFLYVCLLSHKPVSIQRSIKWNLLCRVIVKTMCSSPRAHCVQPGYCSRCSDYATLQDGRPRVRISVRTGYFIFSRNFRQSLGPTQCVPGAYVGGGAEVVGSWVTWTSSVEIKNKWSCNSILPVCFHGMDRNKNFTCVALMCVTQKVARASSIWQRVFVRFCWEVLNWSAVGYCTRRRVCHRRLQWWAMREDRSPTMKGSRLLQ